jgi:hypothetical protein
MKHGSNTDQITERKFFFLSVFDRCAIRGPNPCSTSARVRRRCSLRYRKTCCHVGHHEPCFRGTPVHARRLRRSRPSRPTEMAMRCILLASIMVVALGAAADSADGGWRTDRSADRTYQRRAGWRAYGVANKTSHDGVWQRGYGHGPRGERPRRCPTPGAAMMDRSRALTAQQATKWPRLVRQPASLPHAVSVAGKQLVLTKKQTCAGEKSPQPLCLQ